MILILSTGRFKQNKMIYTLVYYSIEYYIVYRFMIFEKNEQQPAPFSHVNYEHLVRHLKE